MKDRMTCIQEIEKASQVRASKGVALVERFAGFDGWLDCRGKNWHEFRKPVEIMRLDESVRKIKCPACCRFEMQFAVLYRLLDEKELK